MICYYGGHIDSFLDIYKDYSVIGPNSDNVCSPAVRIIVGNVVNPELIVNPVTPIDSGSDDLVTIGPVRRPTENFPMGSVEYPTVSGILVVSVPESILQVIIPVTLLGATPVKENECII